MSVLKYTAVVLRFRESVLSANLGELHQVINQYVEDKNRAPHTLQDLVDAGYMRQMPVDPVTHSSSTWKPVIATVVISPQKVDRGTTDVHNGSSSLSSTGTSNRTW